MPGKLAYHTTVVYKDSAYVFGGNNYAKQERPIKAGQDAPMNSIVFQLVLPDMTWHAA